MVFKAHNLRKHCLQETDNIFVDTCVWYLVHGPYTQPSDRTRYYSSALRTAIAARCHLYTDTTVISEFANRYAKSEYSIWAQNRTGTTFKDYREQSNYLNDAKAISDSIRRILKHATLISTQLSQDDLLDIVTEFETNRRDINDLFIAELCERNGLILLTDDADYKGMDISVLTSNNRLLN